MKYVKSEGDTEFKNELRKGNYVVRAPAMKTSWVVALWIGWEIQNERIQSSLSRYDQSRGKDTDSRGGMDGKRFGSSFHMWDKGICQRP